MGVIKEPKKVILICGVMYSNDKEAIVNSKIAINLLVKKFGKILHESDEFQFNFTDFYENEFGKNLLKKYLAFEKKIDRKNLAKIKIFTNKIEEKFLNTFNRTINLDPGYISEHNLVLASCKEFPHRIYIGNGIHAEVEMIFKKTGIEYPQYAYLDYKTKTAQEFFLNVRKSLLNSKK